MADGADKVLERLSHGFKPGVIANQSLGTEERFEKLNLLKYFDSVTASEETDFSKPDERVFPAALKKSGCCPEEAAMAGDRLDNDIVPAKKLGMTAVLVRWGFGASRVLIPVIQK